MIMRTLRMSGPSRYGTPRHAGGVAVIEFAIALLFLLLLTVGITEIGRAFWYYSSLQKAVREGGRCLSQLEWKSEMAGSAEACRNLVVTDAVAAGVPDLELANVAVTPATWAGGAAPEYVEVRIQDYSITWLWGFGGALQPGQSSELGVVVTMPYMR